MPSDPRVQLIESLNETKALLALLVAAVERADKAVARLEAAQPGVDERLRQEVVGPGAMAAALSTVDATSPYIVAAQRRAVSNVHAPAFGDDDDKF